MRVVVEFIFEIWQIEFGLKQHSIDDYEFISAAIGMVNVMKRSSSTRFGERKNLS
jgi:hypothetical protein